MISGANNKFLSLMRTALAVVVMSIFIVPSASALTCGGMICDPPTGAIGASSSCGSYNECILSCPPSFDLSGGACIVGTTSNPGSYYCGDWSLDVFNSCNVATCTAPGTVPVNNGPIHFTSPVCTCPIGNTWSGGVCTSGGNGSGSGSGCSNCPSGYTWNGTACETAAVPMACAAPFIPGAGVDAGKCIVNCCAGGNPCSDCSCNGGFASGPICTNGPIPAPGPDHYACVDAGTTLNGTKCTQSCPAPSPSPSASPPPLGCAANEFNWDTQQSCTNPSVTMGCRCPGPGVTSGCWGFGCDGTTHCCPCPSVGSTGWFQLNASGQSACAVPSPSPSPGPSPVPAGSLIFNPNTFPFPATAVGASSSPQPITVRNAGSIDVHGCAFSLQGNASDFTMTGASGCADLTIGATCTLTLTANPGAAGTKTAQIRATCAPGGTTTNPSPFPSPPPSCNNPYPINPGSNPSCVIPSASSCIPGTEDYCTYCCCSYSISPAPNCW